MIISHDDEVLDLFRSNKTYPFDEITLGGNHIRGELLLTHDEFHGSLLITECNSFSTLQFVQGFPKMYYYEHQIIEDKNIIINEKLDGTCICIYKLYDKNNEVLEYVPKSRQKAILDKHFIEMYNLCDRRNIDKMGENIDTLYFELYGMLNQHTISYYKTYIDLALLGAYTGKHFLNDKEVTELSEQIQIKKAEQLGIIHLLEDEYKLELTDKYYEETGEYNNKTGKTIDEILKYLKEYLDMINKINLAEKKKVRYERVVLRNGR